MKMGNEEQRGNRSSSVCFRNGGNGKQPKKPKPKKIPQRGLGVAQLEKIRLEDQEINEAVTSPSSATSLCIRSPSAIPFGPRPYPFSSDNLYEHVPSNLHLNVRQHTVGPVPPYESTLATPFGGLMQLGNQQSSFYSSSMVNAFAANSSSAVLSFQTEPPSNQSPYGTYRPVQPDEAEKNVGTKRPCPFSLQEPYDLLPQCKFNPFTSHSLEKATSYRNTSSLVMNGNPNIRNGLPRSMSTPRMMHQTNDIRADKRQSNGDFLKLSPPATMSLLPSSDAKQALFHSFTNHAEENSNISIQHQQQHSFYSFLPAHSTALNGQSTGVTRSYSDETEEHIDLNLKL